MNKTKENELLKRLKSRIKVPCEVGTEETFDGYNFVIKIESNYFGVYTIVLLHNIILDYENVDTIVALIIHHLGEQILSHFIAY